MENITTSFENLENVYKLAKKQKLDEVRFEFIMSALFPDILNNIKEEIRKQYTMGFIAGKELPR